MSRNVNDIINNLSPMQRKKVETRAAQLIAEQMTLQQLRQACKLRQEKVAKSLRIGQEGVSKIEKRGDLLISTLRDYVEAMGGQLSLVVEFPDREPVILSGIAEFAQDMHFINPYEAAAKKYAPERTSVLFVAEAPPDALERYFYFENVERSDWLWIALMKALYPLEWGQTRTERERKEDWLLKFRKSQFRLIDAVKTPIDGDNRQRVTLIRSAAHELIEEIKKIAPKQIVLIKATVHEALFQQLRDACLPVVNEQSLPFPGFGRQTQFHEEFRRLVDTGALRLYPA